MSSRKDINKEIDNYIRGNYSKKIATELLKRDGFSDSEIKEHIHRLDATEKSNEMNYMFVPGFIFIVIASIASCFLGFSSEENGFNTISFIGFLISLPLIYFYYIGNKLAILLTGFAILCFIIFEVISLVGSQMNIFGEIVYILILMLTFLSVKNYYKSV